GAGRADVHAGTLPHWIESFKDADRGRVVLSFRVLLLLGFSHKNKSEYAQIQPYYSTIRQQNPIRKQAEKRLQEYRTCGTVRAGRERERGEADVPNQDRR